MFLVQVMFTDQYNNRIEYCCNGQEINKDGILTFVRAVMKQINWK